MLYELYVDKENHATYIVQNPKVEEDGMYSAEIVGKGHMEGYGHTIWEKCEPKK